MGKKQIGLWCVMADFVGLTAYAIYSEGFIAVFNIAQEFATTHVWGAQILVDFLLAISVALGWVIADARKRDLAYWPFVLLTLTLSIGPLAYLIHRERVLRSLGEHSDGQPELQHA